jgi:phospholipase C
MLIITYDEHGGFYDHVAPPAAAPSGKKGSEHGFMFDRLGPRVPAVVVSPWVGKGVIEHRLLEHCSIVRTVCDLFNVPFITDGRDLKTVCGLGHLATLAAARTDCPETLPPVAVSDIPLTAPLPEGPRELPAGSAIIDQPELMLAKTLRSAAIQNMALEPDRRADILARVSRIRTADEVAQYLDEVGRKLDALDG